MSRLTLLALIVIAQPLAAQTRWIDACGLLGPAELTPLVGSAAAEPGKPNPVAKLRKGQCTWEEGRAPGVSASATLTITIDSNLYAPASALYGRSATNPPNAVRKDEAALGDAAQSTLYPQSAYLPARVRFDICKSHLVLEVEYVTKAPATEHGRDVLRAAAKKAAAGI